MRFYGMGHDEVMALPHKLFFFLSAQIDRIRSEEILDLMPALGCVMGGDHVSGVFESLKSRVGTPLIAEQIVASKEDIRRAKAKLGMTF